MWRKNVEIDDALALIEMYDRKAIERALLSFEVNTKLYLEPNELIQYNEAQQVLHESW